MRHNSLYMNQYNDTRTIFTSLIFVNIISFHPLQPIATKILTIFSQHPANGRFSDNFRATGLLAHDRKRTGFGNFNFNQILGQIGKIGRVLAQIGKIGLGWNANINVFKIIFRVIVTFCTIVWQVTLHCQSKESSKFSTSIPTSHIIIIASAIALFRK